MTPIIAIVIEGLDIIVAVKERGRESQDKGFAGRECRRAKAGHEERSGVTANERQRRTDIEACAVRSSRFGQHVRDPDSLNPKNRDETFGSWPLERSDRLGMLMAHGFSQSSVPLARLRLGDLQPAYRCPTESPCTSLRAAVLQADRCQSFDSTSSSSLERIAARTDVRAVATWQRGRRCRQFR